MSSVEARPWLEELADSSPLRELLESASVDEPTTAQLLGLEAKLGPLMGPPGGGAPPSNSPPNAPGGGPVPGAGGGFQAAGAVKTWVAVSAAAGLVGVGAFQAGRAFERAPTPPPVVAVSASSLEPELPPAPTAPEPAVPLPTPPPPARIPPAKAAQPEASSVSEAQLLEQAMRAVQEQDLVLAWRQVQAHQRRYPRGALEQERELLAVQILVGQGQTQAAQVRAEAFKARWPTSPHLRRLESMVP